MDFILVGLALFGFFPFLVVLYRKRKFEKMRSTGILTTGTVTSLQGISYRGINLMSIEYTVKETGQRISKNLMIAGFPYTVGQEIPLYYNPVKPTRIQLDAKKSFKPMIIFTLLIAGFIIFAAWKLREMIPN